MLDPIRLRLRGSEGIELAADQFGPVDGPLVLFLHGGGQTRHSWKQTGAKLAAAGMRVVTLDARGHGDSEWLQDGDYRRDTMVADLVSVLEQLDAPSASKRQCGRPVSSPRIMRTSIAVVKASTLRAPSSSKPCLR
jgi:alpha-beta hydrolase superfamily lysophospholipase